MSTSLAVSEVALSAGSPLSARRSYFHPADLNLAKAIGQRFALAIELNARGAREAGDECGSPLREGAMTVVYTAAETAHEARVEFDAWGTVREIAPLFNEVKRDTPKAADEFCHGCWYPASDVGLLGDYVVRATESDVRVRYCAECAEAHASVQRAVAQVRAYRAGHPESRPAVIPSAIPAAIVSGTSEVAR